MGFQLLFCDECLTTKGASVSEPQTFLPATLMVEMLSHLEMCYALEQTGTG